jgi:Fic family protein
MENIMQPYKPQKLPIENMDWKPLITLVGRANSELSKYDGLLKGIPNPHVLLSPLTIQEATLSSSIEGTQATISEVLEKEAGKSYSEEKQNDIQEIINYRTAMLAAEEMLKKRPFIHLNMIRELHSILLSGVRGQNKARGQFRLEQNWIGSPGCSIKEAKYIPPSPMDLMEALDNWEKYVNSDDIDILIQLSFVHAQFEIIHPFKDGNGRIGRILIPIFLFARKYLTCPVFYLSEYLENNRSEYYRRLNDITRKNDWQGWTVFFLNAIIKQAQGNSIKAEKIISLYKEMKEKIPLCVHSQYASYIADSLFMRPIFNSVQFMENTKIESRGTANKMLSKLVQEGILTISRKPTGRNAAIYSFDDLIDIVA